MGQMVAGRCRTRPMVIAVRGARCVAGGAQYAGARAGGRAWAGNVGWAWF
ncbi:hypothetical protein GCM10009654_64380 [Streptomyces hebeiensis]|uniref:Uncharacterized protein n=1 Tax=Streptomyces hebeiensis TaxID=229486 RepID=A0ABN1V7P6_9ACTN